MTKERLQQFKERIYDSYLLLNEPKPIEIEELVNEIERLINLRTQDIENLHKVQKELEELKK